MLQHVSPAVPCKRQAGGLSKCGKWHGAWWGAVVVSMVRREEGVRAGRGGQKACPPPLSLLSFCCPLCLVASESENGGRFLMTFINQVNSLFCFSSPFFFSDFMINLWGLPFKGEGVVLPSLCSGKATGNQSLGHTWQLLPTS